MRILIACEESQRACQSFRDKGHEAYSNDIQECSGGHPEWHILADSLLAIRGGVLPLQNGETVTIDHWDMIIAHPPCTYLTNASAVRMRVKGEIQPERYAKAMEARDFFMQILNADCDRICIENPVPLKIVNLPHYSQIIQPYEYGEPWSKKTCLWLKGLPYLMPTEIIAEGVQPWVNGGCKDAHGNYRRFQGRKERDPKNRAKSFWGIVRAMAEQWG